MSSTPLIALEHVLYLGGGYLYFSQLPTTDAPRNPLPYPLLLLSLFMGMSADTIVGIVLLQATRSPLWVPTTSSTSCDLGVFMDDAADAVAPPDLELVQIRRLGEPYERASLLKRPMRSMQSCPRPGTWGDKTSRHSRR